MKLNDGGKCKHRYSNNSNSKHHYNSLSVTKLTRGHNNVHRGFTIRDYSACKVFDSMTNGLQMNVGKLVSIVIHILQIPLLKSLIRVKRSVCMMCKIIGMCSRMCSIHSCRSLILG